MGVTRGVTVDPKEMGQYLTDLPEERIAKFRLMAAHARQCGDNARSPEVANAHIAIAMAWETMAVEYERTHDAISPSRRSPPQAAAPTVRTPERG
jgi:hypothetical protein